MTKNLIHSALEIFLSKNKGVVFLLHLTLISNAQFVHIDNPLGSLRAAESRTINSIAFDQKGNAFFATHWNTIKEVNKSSSCALFLFQDNSWKEIRFSKFSNPFEQIYNLRLDKKNNLIGFIKEKGTIYNTNLGYYLFDDKYKFTDLLSKLKLPSGVYSDVQFDNGSNLWFSQETLNFRETGSNSYLGKLENGQLSYLSFPWPITSFKLAADNSVFTKRDFLIYLFDTATNNKEKITDRADSFAEIATDGKVFYCAYGSLYVYNEKGSKELSNLPDNLGQDDYGIINCTFIDSKDNFYLGTRKGLYIFSRNEWVIYNSQNSNLEGNNITAISEDSDQNIWIAGDSREGNNSPNKLKAFIAYLKD